MNCAQCGVLNAAENEFCSACGGRLRATGGPPAVVPVGRVFRDPSKLTRWLRWLLISGIVISAIATLSGIAEVRLLYAIRDGGFSSASEMNSAAATSDRREGAIALAYVLVYLTTVVLFAIWTHRMSANIHALGAVNLRFRPGWAVGWYFVPIANLWKPFQAMSEIWRASKDPMGWEAEAVGGLARWWWFWWLVSNIVGSITANLAEHAHAVDALISVSMMQIVSAVLNGIAMLAAFLLVSRVQLFQSHAADRSLGSVFA